MTWSADKIRHLRMRLGWSHADLARRLVVPSLSIQNWEKGVELPLQQHIQQLEFIEKEADEQAEVLAQESLAEKLMSENAQDQIDHATLKNYTSDDREH